VLTGHDRPLVVRGGGRAGFRLCALWLDEEIKMTPDPIAERTSLQIERTCRPANVELRCHGEIDLATVASLRRALTGAIASGRPRVEVDLREVRFLDSSALCALLEAHRELARSDRKLSVNASLWGAKLFRLTGLDLVFEVHANEPPATTSLTSRQLARPA
jgi:anti-anti-sigma factor